MVMVMMMMLTTMMIQEARGDDVDNDDTRSQRWTNTAHKKADELP